MKAKIKVKKGWWWGMILSIVIIAWIVKAPVLGVMNGFSIDHFLAWFDRSKTDAPFLSIILMVVYTFVWLPVEPLVMANGAYFGPTQGVWLSWIGGIIGAWIAFGLGRLVGRPCLSAVVSNADRKRLDQWMEKRGMVLLVAVRLIPFVSYPIVSLLAGLISVRGWRFTWTTAVGLIPMVWLNSWLGWSGFYQ